MFVWSRTVLLVTGKHCPEKKNLVVAEECRPKNDSFLHIVVAGKDDWSEELAGAKVAGDLLEMAGAAGA